MDIRVLEENYVSELADLMFALDLYYSEKSLDIKERRERSKIFINKKQVYGYFLDEKLIGYLLIEYFDNAHHNFPSSIFISEIFVLEEYRRKGIGSEFLKYVLKLKFLKDCRYFSLTYSPDNDFLKEFYENFGFKFNRVLESGNIAMIKERE